jgi:acyl-lipid omega-6 desaturase (Delta-12 desaturase)
MRVEPTAEAAARAWRARLPHVRQRRTVFQGGLIFAISAAAYVVTYLGFYLLPWWWARWGSLLACPMAIGALFVVGHDACHHALTPIGWLNRLLGRLAFLPAWHPFTSWTHCHNRLHHGGTNLKGRESCFVPFTKAEFERLPAWRRTLEWAYRTPPGIGVFYAIDFWLLRLVFPRRRFVPPERITFLLDRLLVASFFVFQLVVSWQLAQRVDSPVVPPALLALAGVFVPFSLWIWFMGFVSYVQHTHPRMAWYADEAQWSFYHVQLRSTAHVTFPWPIERLLNNIMDHPAHHLDPSLPLYQLPAAQRDLEQQTQHHAVVISWTPWDYLRTCAACKLYDFERQCWTDFQGNPTSALGLPGLPDLQPSDIPGMKSA